MSARQILVVEDEFIVAAHIQRSLISLGYAVPTVVSSGEEAIRKTAENSPDLVLMDIVLEGEMDGIEAANQIRARFNIPIVYLTSRVDEETLNRAKITEPFGYIVKPFDRSALHTTIEISLYKHRMEKALSQQEQELLESQRRLEETLVELRATQQQIAQQERLRALGTMASGIAHDFNNALAPILSYTDLLLMVPENLDNKEKLTRSLQIMRTAAQDAANVVRRMRQFYRKREEGEILWPVDLNQMVEQAIELTHPKWKAQAQASGITVCIETDLQPVPVIRGNEAELREVLTNLILNAVDAMPTNGAITIRTNRDGEDVILEMSDTGAGMSKEVEQRCFEPFFSTKGEKGTGLGLSMAYGIISRHEGTISVKGREGKGTTFTIRLPVYKKPRAESKRTEAGVNLPPLHVLLVDDKPMARDAITQYLTTDGHTVETAANGREGLEKFHAGRFNLVITDQAMPDMSGEQLAIAIKQIAPNKPIIMLTGFGDMMQASNEMPRGIEYLVSKPITLTNFREALAKTIEVKIE